MLRVFVTRHALERLFERFPKKKFEADTALNIIENVIKSGTVVLWRKEIRISTSNYTLCCVLESKPKLRLIIKTILKTKELGESYKKALHFGRRSPWKIIYFENRDQIKTWCGKIKRMKNLCKICGISKDQTRIERCKMYGFYICSYCCISVGGFSEKCRGCVFDVYELIEREIKKIKNDDFNIFV